MKRIIDFHAHILPGADHGCDSLEMCKSQLEMARAAGITHIVATPHFYPNEENVNTFIEKREKAFELYKSIEDREDLPVVLKGAEVLIWKNMDNMNDIEKLCVEGTNVILIELPFSKKFGDDILNTLLGIKGRGLEVVLAHVERYNKEEIMKLIDNGFKVQLNSDSIFKFSKKKLCREYLQSGNVVALGSDIHKLNNNYKSFAKVVKKYKTDIPDVINGRIIYEKSECNCTCI